MSDNELEVYCTIDNCQWWSEGNMCNASVILITHDNISDHYPENVDSDDVNQIVLEHGNTPADNSMETCCKTFTQKKDAKIDKNRHRVGAAVGRQ